MGRLWRQCQLRPPWGTALRRLRAGELQWLPERLFRRTRTTERLTTDGRMAASILGSGMAANPVGGASLYGPQVRAPSLCSLCDALAFTPHWFAEHLSIVAHFDALEAFCGVLSQTRLVLEIVQPWHVLLYA